MARRKVEDDFSDARRKEAHEMVDVLFRLRLDCVIAGRQKQGGVMWRVVGDRRSIRALTNRLNEMSKNGNI